MAARWLAQAGWEIETRLIFPEKELSALTKRKLSVLRDQEGGRGLSAPIKEDAAAIEAQRALLPCQTIILDGLLGLGAHPPLREPIRGACREINSLRANVRVVAIDLPTGLDGDSGEADDDCVVADFTITVGCAKSGLVADSAIDFVGRLEVVPLDELRPEKPKLVPNWRFRNRSATFAAPEIFPTKPIWPGRHRRELARFYGRGDHVR